jgi:putative glutathione S-transferase
LIISSDANGRSAAKGHRPDPVNGFAFLSEAYEATQPGYEGHVSVPVLWDRQSGRIVRDNFPDITIDLGTQFEARADPSVVWA